MRRRLVVGNWKMNGNLADNAALLKGITTQWPVAGEGKGNVDTAVCPPFVYLSQAAQALKDSVVELGAQTVNEHDAGAFTGEVSGEMLVDVGCRYVIVGHNERRRMQVETDAQVADKFHAALQVGLTPILCVGESEQERDAGQALETIGRQLRVVVERVGLEAFEHAVVAYEPVWAVGTGKVASPEQAEEVHRFIRAELGKLGPQTQILYGGSVKPGNAEQLFALPDIDGALLGGASLNADDFVAICKAAA
ncbi:triose-phosphate isomerase [Marinimicrobium agarilyticum]|uniref:triose-phosphate isomerase n=1 Tax=Marinimicrobium agarilyticum TaxID=306546 RepID=UPI000488972B|nr:triose-phosphate isomerase [Marinimicrobium agarilyticum]